MAHPVEAHISAGAGIVGPKALLTIGRFVATGVTLIVAGVATGVTLVVAGRVSIAGTVTVARAVTIVAVGLRGADNSAADPCGKSETKANAGANRSASTMITAPPTMTVLHGLDWRRHRVPQPQWRRYRACGDRCDEPWRSSSGTEMKDTRSTAVET